MTYEQDSGTPKDFSCLGNWQWMNRTDEAGSAGLQGSDSEWNDGVVDAECCS
jgi:hypothetical protein